MAERGRESGQRQASATLAPRKELPLPIEKVARWPPMPVWTLERRENALTLGESEHAYSVVQSIA